MKRHSPGDTSLQTNQDAREQLYPSEVLDTPAAVTNELNVWSIGPAVVLVIEREAPVRTLEMFYTEAEYESLLECVRGSVHASHVLTAYLEAHDDQDRFAKREHDHHSTRLEQARKLDLRVGDPRRCDERTPESKSQR